MPRSTTALLLWRKRRRRHRWVVHGRNCSEILPSKFGNSLLRASLKQIFFLASIFFGASHFILNSLVISVSLMFCWASQWHGWLSPLLFISCQEFSMTVEVWYWPFLALPVLWQTIGWGLISTFPSTAGSWWSQRGKFWNLVITIHIAFEGCEHILFKLVCVCVCEGFLWFLMVWSILFFMFVDKLDLESPESLSGYVLILFQVVLNCKNGKLSQ
jgi:hypothetical protein